MKQHDNVSVLFREGLVPVTDLPNFIPGSNGKRLHRALGWRWVNKGLPGRDGSRVFLEAVRVGRRWMTSLEAIERFIESTTPLFHAEGLKGRSASHRGAKPATREVLIRHGLINQASEG